MDGMRKLKTWIAPLACGALLLVLEGCRGVQSALEPASDHARQLSDLFWWMLSGATVIWAGMIALAVYAIRSRTEDGRKDEYNGLIIGGGAVFPTVVLGVLLVHGLGLLPELLAPPPEGALRVRVEGEQWWWRVTYEGLDGSEVETANEIRLPVGEPVVFQLEARDVIHSFWVPSIAGKVDMTPGRSTRLTVRPTRTGTFRGACAEFCGAAHALMSFYVIVMEKDEFAAWWSKERGDAVALDHAGAGLFVQHGCGACHTIRGTQARGTVGPDLTHVGGRVSLGAGILRVNRVDLTRWLESTGSLKPEVHMPAFGMLPPAELEQMAGYLEALR